MLKEAGSAGDTLSRVAANYLQAKLGRSVIVENRAGAGGITGIRSVVASEGDGSILLVAPSATVTMIPLYNPDTGYDARKDLKPISHLVSQDLALGVGPALPATSIKELIEIVRKDPSKGSYGTPGAGSSLHLIGVKLGQLANIKMVPVHYRGAALALNDVIAGQLPMILSPMPDQIEQHRAGKVRIIATAGPQRSAFLDGVPTFAESGVDINAICGGRGRCTSCRVKLVAGTAPPPTIMDELQLGDALVREGYRLSCQWPVTEAVTVLAYDAQGLPALQGMYEIPFTAVIPTCAYSSPERALPA